MKKILLCLSVLLSINSFAQNIDSSFCKEYLIKHYDQMTNKNTIMSRILTISGDSTQGNGQEFKILLHKTGSDPILEIDIVGDKPCIDKYNTIYFLFTDGSRMHFNSNTDFNCKGETYVFFGTMFGNEMQLKTLKTKKIKAIRVMTRNGYVEKNLSNEEAEVFINSLNCICKYSYRWKGY